MTVIQGSTSLIKLLRLDGLVLAGVTSLLGARIPEEAGLVPRIANQDHCDYEHQRADGTGFSLQKEPSEIENDEHDMVVEESWIHRLWKQQDWNQPLQAVHFHNRLNLL